MIACQYLSEGVNTCRKGMVMKVFSYKLTLSKDF